GPIGTPQARTLAAARTWTLVVAMHPQEFAGGSVQAHHVAAEARGGVDPAVHEQRGGLIVRIEVGTQRIGGKAPHHLQLVEVGRVDLLEWRVTGAVEVVGVMQPLALLQLARSLGGTWGPQAL